MAGRSPATAPMRMAAARPPAQGAGRYDRGPVFEVGVDEGGDGACGDSGGASEQGQEDGFGEELGADLALGRAE
jgi:hypothetical protein